ncbi:MAG: two pore domain potassium channel family protein [Bacteroidales bacterium]|nr:two pore domain potassium channel family protein [Bacteroidales bacterium]
MANTISDKIRHFFHVVSNIRPIIWICLYIVLTPIFALIYWGLPDGQFRIPDGAGTDYGSWLYYSIVTITTLGFGDYTPAHGIAQCVTALEVMCGLIILGLFLNAVGAMKSEIDVESELEKQRRLHAAGEKEKLIKTAPSILHNINAFLAYCYAVTTPASKRADEAGSFNPDFGFSDMADLYNPSGLSSDYTRRPAVERLLKSASRTSLYLDSLEGRIDMSLWPELMEDCFSFVANYQLFASADVFEHRPGDETAADKDASSNTKKEISDRIASWQGDPNKADSALAPYVDLYHFIKENGQLALKIETAVTRIASESQEA